MCIRDRFSTKLTYFLYSGVVLSLSFLALYFIYTSSAPDKGGYHYLLTPADSIVSRVMFSLKALVLYAITDPLLVFLLPILLFLSVYQRVILNKDGFASNMIKYTVFIDACAISALSLVAAYVVLGFHGFRYLLPAYPFGLIAIAAYLQNYMPIIKKYFKSIYFHEPGRILFEIATDGPGMMIDEDLDNLGDRLSLPPFLDPDRERIEAGLQLLL